MSRIEGSILLVGSVPGSNQEEIMRLCTNELGHRIDLLPDGETGFRRVWINFLAARIYDACSALDTLNRPEPVNPADDGEWRAIGDEWIPKGYHDHWQFQVRPGENVHFEHLGYAQEAAASYDVFKRLRAEGVVSQDQRFMVAMPMCESAVRPFLGKAGVDDYQEIARAYTEAMAREIARMLESIPAEDLAVQWDVCMEMLAVDLNDENSALFPWKPKGLAMDRYSKDVATFSSFVPEEVALGLHFCYGDLGHKHFVEPRDLENATKIARESENVIDRSVDFCHVPVPRDRMDDAYFQPLADWPKNLGKLYLGLIHHTGGVDASLSRLETARRHVDGFGIATECGFGRRAKETVPELMRIHREIADRL